MANGDTTLDKVKNGFGRSGLHLGVGSGAAAVVAYLVAILLNPIQDKVADNSRELTELRIKVGDSPCSEINARLEGRLDHLMYRIELLERAVKSHKIKRLAKDAL